MMGATTSLFGAVHLGFIVIETEKFTDWHRFGRDAIGLHVDRLSNRDMRFRLDDHQCRFLLQRGDAEDVTAFGWEIDDHESFDRIVARVRDRGVPVTEGTEEDAARRGVERLLRFPPGPPKGIDQEIFTRAHLTPAPPLVMSSDGFVTGASGMGHVAITSTQPSKIQATTTPSSTPACRTTSTKPSAA